MSSAVSLRGIGKRYRISPSRSSLLKEALSFGKLKRSHDFWALEDINLEVEPGTTLGILGRNGAGKSTLLRIISGVSQPTTGEVEVHGRLAAIFSTGAGFNPEFTGRENVMLNGLILGIDYEELLERFDDIAAFADIGEFIDQPIRTYSSGMRSRLGFAVAVNVNPDILVLDEALSAGDAAFKKKALQRMYDLRDSGTTVLFVSHSMGMVKRFCTQAVLLHKGRMVASGDSDGVVNQYRELLEKAHEKTAETSERERQLDDAIEHEDEEDMPAWGNDPAGKGAGRRTGEASILRTELLDGTGRQVRAVDSGTALTVRVHLRYERSLEESVVGITVRDKAGISVFSTNTAEEGAPLGRRGEGEQVAVDFRFDVPLRPGEYGVDAAVFDPREEGSPLDVADGTSFEISRSRPVRGLIYLPTTVEIHDPERESGSPV
jgi:ABC-2 type transport system ATP-binding protein